MPDYTPSGWPEANAVGLTAPHVALSVYTEEAQTMKLRLATESLLVLLAGNALADPETAYQGGKAVSKTISGDKTKVDDRDLEARSRDKAREMGAKASPASSSKDKSASKPSTDSKK
jgi:hypothetical protein